MGENSQKIVTDEILKLAIEKVLIALSDYIYDETDYTETEVDGFFDGTKEQIEYYSSLINDQSESSLRLWSSSKVKESIATAILESNEYSDNLISDLSSISLKYVESLPDTGDSSTIYILKSTDSNPDTLNLFDGTQWVTIGNFEIDMANYVTTDDMNTELGKKANDNEVVKVSNILTDTTGASNNNVLSASATVTELDKKVNKTDIVDNLTSTNTDKPLSAKQGKALDDKKLNKADADKITLTNIDNVNIKDYILENCTDENKIYYIAARSNCTELPKVSSNYFIIVQKVGSYTIKVTAKELAGSNNEYMCTYRSDNAKWSDWEKVLLNSDIVTTIDKLSTDDKIPSARAIYDNPKNKIPVISSGTDIFAYADSIEEYVTITVKLMNGVNSPYGADNINNDFYYTIYNMPSVNYKRIVAYDIRKNDMYMNIKHVTWGTWQKVCTTSVADMSPTEISSFVDTDVSGTVNYRVKNGICFVKLWGVKSTKAGRGKFLLNNSSLPIPNCFDTGNALLEANGDGTTTAFAFVDANGALIVHFYKANSEAYGSFSYPVSE